MRHIMLDLETFSTKPNAAIVAIGACVFNPYASEPIRKEDKFYLPVFLESSMAAGLHVDGNTAIWWLGRSPEAIKATFFGEPQPLKDALIGFAHFVSVLAEPVALWGNGATFDNVVLKSAFEAVNLPVPWSYKNDKCYRTVLSLLPYERKPAYITVGTYHNALDDAISQALHLQKVFALLNLTAV